MIVQGQCTVFKKNLLAGVENFSPSLSPYVYKIALYDANANLNSQTTAYSITNEISGTGYTSGGQILLPLAPNYDPTTNTAWVSFQTVYWSPASFTCRGALIYNATTGAAVCVLNFGSDKTANTSFTIRFPTANATDAIIRIS